MFYMNERNVIKAPSCVVENQHRSCFELLTDEEILYILEGEGEAWVDGEVGKFKTGDAVLFPINSKHMVRNTGTTSLRTCSIFSPPTSPDSYTLYEDEGW